MPSASAAARWPPSARDSARRPVARWRAASSLRPRSRDAMSIDLSPIKALIALILRHCKPVSVWLFGSRAKGQAREDSDWDLLVVLPDETPEEEMFYKLPPRNCIASPK